LWGGLFALIFGMELGVMRLSTVVMVALGSVALYSLLRQLGVTRSRSTLGAAVYLFNPLTFVLAFTFMTDPHFTSVMLIAVALSVRGLNPADCRPRIIVLGSLFAGFAFLIRQQGALIPLAIVLSLLFARRLRPNLASLRLVLQVTALPAIMLVVYYAWLRWVNDVPEVQSGFLRAVIERHGWAGTWRQVRYLSYIALAYVGFAAIPLVLTLAPSPRRWRWPWRMRRADEGSPSPVSAPSGFFTSPVGWWCWLGWLGVAVTGLFFLTLRGRRMPYIPQFLGSSGFGPPDVRGSRHVLIESAGFYSALTIVSVVAAIALGAIICRRLGVAASPERAGAGVVAMVLLWQLVGVLPPSYQYINQSGSLDRYLLPLIPLTIALAMWALRDVRLFQPLGWVAVLLFGSVATAGTRDYLVFMDAVWGMAERANAAGIPNTKLDAGSGWDGYHLYTLMLDENITAARSPAGAPWWVYFYAKPTDSTYLVSTNPQSNPGYYVVAVEPYDQWLEDDPVAVYLMALNGAPRPVLD
ncbi:MAG: glycosyltransferase family 39 protein, partial [Chloroflexia bacterium]|nr:glycosyltransferase family 39 protein [Chloroflexia bacterium]